MITCDKLNARAGSANRNVVYIPAMGNEPFDGTITVNEEIGVRNRRVITRKYTTTEVAPNHGYRCFDVTKMADLGREDLKAGKDGQLEIGTTYQVRIARFATSCTCKAGLAHMRCLHVDAVKTLIDNGTLVNPLDSGCESAQHSYSEM